MKEFERSKEQVNLYEDILKYIEYKKANGMKYSNAIKEVNDIVKHVEASINTVLNNVCCICGEELKGFGNNPYPISDEGRCCDKCNDKVIEARIADLVDMKGCEYNGK